MDRYTPVHRAIEVVDLGRYGASDLILLKSSFSLQEILREQVQNTHKKTDRAHLRF